MATDYPGALDTSSTLPNPSATNPTNNPGLAAGQSNQNDAIKAIEAKLGTGASTPTANTLMFGTGTGTSAWTAVTSSQLRSTLSDETGTGSAVFATTPTLVTPKVDTINENTPANGVTIDGLNIKDGALNTANSIVNSNITTGNLYASKFYNPYKFNAYRSGALNSPAGSQATIVFDAKRFDTSSSYSTSTGKFTAPIAGFYMFTSTILLGAAVTRIFLTWIKNGAVYRRSTDNASSGYAVSDCLFIQLAASDTIEVQLFSGSSQAIDTTGQSEFTGYLMSAT